MSSPNSRYPDFSVIFQFLRPGPRLDWDPDIVAGLDDDFDYSDPENVLDDDFMALANTDDGTEIADFETPTSEWVELIKLIENTYM